MKNKKKILWIAINILIALICLVLGTIGCILNNIYTFIFMPLSILFGIIDVYSWAYFYTYFIESK